MPDPIRVGMLSLGCPRTLVDSELLLGRLKRVGYDVAPELQHADVAIINTCSFVQDAIQESIDAILDAIELKRQGRLTAVIVSGCLPQRYPVELYDELREVDGFMGTDAFVDVDRVVAEALAGKRPLAVRKRPSVPHFGLADREPLTPSHYAYLKISEGCLKGCAFCIIPKLKGSLRSRPIDDVLTEARALIEERGAQELVVVGQDTSDYGVDFSGTSQLVALLDRLSQLNGVRWIRLLYCHPWGVTDELIEVIRSRPTICKYLDMAIEHSEDTVLQRMNRRMTRARLEEIMQQLRSRVPGIALRTSAIVGFPGETEEEFQGLCRFIEHARFDRLGAFTFSSEQGTAAATLPHQISDQVKEERFRRLMLIQQDVARTLNAALLGRELLVHVDERDPHDPHVALARSAADCPEVDGVVYIKGGTYAPGDFVRVRIIDTYEYDLVGVPARE